MPSSRIAVPLMVAATLFACQPGDEGTAADGPLAPEAGTDPSFGATVSRSSVDFFFLQDFDRDYSATIGLVSDVADLNETPDCGGDGPRIVDPGIEKVVSTAGSTHLRDRWHKATFVLYDAATNDVCELSSHPVVARGRVNFKFAIRDADVTEPTIHFKLHMTGRVDLTGGGQAHVLLIANFFFDDVGVPHVRTDRFELKPVGN